MSRLSRVRRIAKWSGVSVSLGIVIAGVASCWLTLGCEWLFNHVSLWIGKGRVHLVWLEAATAGERWSLNVGTFTLDPLLYVNDDGRSLNLGTAMYVIRIPFLLPLLLIAPPTAHLFYRDRRHPPGHCQQCGYDLRGNVSGMCPECGRAMGGE